MMKEYRFRVPGDTLQGDDESVSGRERDSVAHETHYTSYTVRNIGSGSFLLPKVQYPLEGQGNHIIEALRSHSDTATR